MRMRQNTYIHDFSCYTTTEEEDWRRRMRREDLLQRTRDGFVGRECLKIQLSFRTRCLYMYVTALPRCPLFYYYIFILVYNFSHSRLIYSFSFILFSFCFELCSQNLLFSGRIMYYYFYLK